MLSPLLEVLLRRLEPHYIVEIRIARGLQYAGAAILQSQPGWLA